MPQSKAFPWAAWADRLAESQLGTNMHIVAQPQYHNPSAGNNRENTNKGSKAGAKKE